MILADPYRNFQGIGRIETREGPKNDSSNRLLKVLYRDTKSGIKIIAMLKSLDLRGFQNNSLKRRQQADLLSYAPPSFEKPVNIFKSIGCRTTVSNGIVVMTAVA